MNTCILHVLRDGIFHNLTLVGNGVELYLLGVLHELADYHGIVLGDLGGHVQEAMQFIVVVADVHGCT